MFETVNGFHTHAQYAR